MSSTEPLRVALLVNEDATFLLHRLQLARAVRDAGHAVTVLARESGHRAAIEAEGFAFHPIRLSRGNLNPLRELATLGDILRGYRAHRPHLVHQFSFKLIVLGTLAARLAGARAVVNAVPGLGYAFTGGGPRRGLLRVVALAGYRAALGRGNSHTVFENRDDRAEFIARGLTGADTSLVIPGAGINTEAFSPSPPPPGPPVVLFAARMLWDKGIAQLIGAARLLKAEGLAFKLLLAGAPDPQNPASLEERVLREWQAEGVAEWLGFHDDMSALIAASHVVCLPSYREGLPVTLLEAAASGRPVITTDVPGCRDALEPHGSGLLVPPRDPHALAAALRTLLSDAPLRERMGQRGHELALQRFSAQVVNARTLTLYTELTGAGFGQPPSQGEALD